jgi:hypothetical protein
VVDAVVGVAVVHRAEFVEGGGLECRGGGGEEGFGCEG